MRLHNLGWWQPLIDRHPICGKIYGCLNLYRRYFLFYYGNIKFFLINFFSNKDGITNKRCCTKDIVVSLTTFDKRINDVYITIESVMSGTILPNSIVLWLPIQMKDTELPATLKRLQNRGLEISFCEDIRSFKKLIPSLSKYRDAIIVTIDDDQIYEKNMLKYLVDSYKEYPLCISANTVYRMTFDAKGELTNYSDWISGYPGHDVSIFNFPIGEGGILYPPNSINDEVFNRENFMSLCPLGDDIWFYAMSKLNGYKVVKTRSHDPRGIVSLENPNVQQCALKNVNVGKIDSLNDKQIHAVFQKYNIYSLLKDKI